MGEHTRLAHAGDFGQGANAQTLHADLSGQAQRCIHDGRLGLQPLLQGTAFARPTLGWGDTAGFDGKVVGGHEK